MTLNQLKEYVNETFAYNRRSMSYENQLSFTDKYLLLSGQTIIMRNSDGEAMTIEEAYDTFTNNTEKNEFIEKLYWSIPTGAGYVELENDAEPINESNPTTNPKPNPTPDINSGENAANPDHDKDYDNDSTITPTTPTNLDDDQSDENVDNEEDTNTDVDDEEDTNTDIDEEDINSTVTPSTEPTDENE